MLKYPRLFKFPPNAFSVCILEIPQNKNQTPFLFFSLSPKKTLSDTWRGAILPYWHDYRFVGMVFGIYTDRQIFPCCILHYRQYYKSLEVGNRIYTDPQISPSIAIRKTRPCDLYPLTPHFYIVKLGFTGVYIFLIFAPKHRLWVRVRTASVRRF